MHPHSMRRVEKGPLRQPSAEAQVPRLMAVDWPGRSTISDLTADPLLHEQYGPTWDNIREGFDRCRSMHDRYSPRADPASGRGNWVR
jgi:hypothetical protein